MEDIDNIILDSLRNLHCDIEDTITCLKDFDSDTVVLAISSCLEVIKPNIAFPKKLPPSMSLRLKIATNLAQQIKDLGFPGDMGYQTILYCNEVEVRRVLMFLIERLPRDTNKSIQIEENGYVPKLVRQIEEKIRLSLEQMWLPSSIFQSGIRECDSGYLVHSFGDSCHLKTQNLHVPSTKEVTDDVKRDFWIHHVADVTRQCSPRQLIPSLLFKDNEFSFAQHRAVLRELPQNITGVSEPIDIGQLAENTIISKSISQEGSVQDNTNQTELLREFEKEKSRLFALQETFKKSELILLQTRSQKEKEETTLKDTLSKINIKEKTLALIDKDENIVKLKAMAENSNERLASLADQWNEIQAPLLKEYLSLRSKLSNEQQKIQMEQNKLQNLKETHTSLISDLKEKEMLESHLIIKLQQINKTNNRSGYTKRILEIIGNIKKQNNEIQKVLKDTKEVQKDINSLTGQVDRSFTLADEMIFHDAKNDEVARKAYKLLAALRNECSDVLKAVSDLGLAERESRNLQEQVESERAKEISEKLNRVLTDLEQIKKENGILLKQS